MYDAGLCGLAVIFTDFVKYEILKKLSKILGVKKNGVIPVKNSHF